MKFSGEEEVSETIKNATEALLLKRLKQEEGTGFTLEATAEGFRVVTLHTNQPIAAMASVMGYFGSAKLGIYDVYPVDAPELRPVLDSFPWPSFAIRPTEATGYNRAIVASTTNIARKRSLRRDLQAATPSALPVRYFWSKPNQVNNAGQGPARSFDLVAVKTVGKEAGPRLDNAAVATTAVSSTLDGMIAVMVDFTETAAVTWSEMTAEAAADNNRQIAIVVNDEVLAIPSVQEAITGGKSMITGNFSVEIADALAQQLKWKALPASLELVSQQVID